MTEVTLTVDGMMCGMCEAHIKDAVRKRIPEAKHLSADHTKGTATFRLEKEMPKSMLTHELKSEFSPMGYELLDLETKEVEDKKGFFGKLFS